MNDALELAPILNPSKTHLNRFVEFQALANLE
jgi:hypothetical protein